MTRHRYLKQHPTEREKDNAMNFYKPETLDDPVVAKFLEDQRKDRENDVTLDEAAYQQQHRPSRERAEAAAVRHQFTERLVSSTQPDGTVTYTDLRGRFRDLGSLDRFIWAGNATVTLVSKKTGERFTYKFVKADPRGPDPTRPVPVFVHVLTGPKNTSDYSYLGTIWPDSINRLSSRTKSRIGDEAPSYVAMRWFLDAVQRLSWARIDQLLEIWHEGRCGRCGRKLTVPESIESGFGPECRGLV